MFYLENFFFSFCEDLGYLWNWEINIDKEINNTGISPDSIKLFGKAGSIVIRLLHPLLGMEYKLFLDNWYTSPAGF